MGPQRETNQRVKARRLKEKAFRWQTKRWPQWKWYWSTEQPQWHFFRKLRRRKRSQEKSWSLKSLKMRRDFEIPCKVKRRTLRDWQISTWPKHLYETSWKDWTWFKSSCKSFFNRFEISRVLKVKRDTREWQNEDHALMIWRRGTPESCTERRNDRRSRIKNAHLEDLGSIKIPRRCLLKRAY